MKQPKITKCVLTVHNLCTIGQKLHIIGNFKTTTFSPPIIFDHCSGEDDPMNWEDISQFVYQQTTQN